MNNKIILDKNAMNALDKKVKRALVQTALTLQDEIRQEQIIPRDKGHLQGEGFVVDLSDLDRNVVKLGHSADVDYAKYLYYNPNIKFHRDKNPNAQSLWFNPWLKGGIYSKRPQEIFEAWLKKEL